MHIVRLVVFSVVFNAFGQDAKPSEKPKDTAAVGCKADSDCSVGSICTKGACGVALCPQIYAPVCGKDGKTYSNACTARARHVEVVNSGECKKPSSEAAIAALDEGATSSGAVQAFHDDAKVQAAIAGRKKSLPVEGPIQTALIKSGPCGFAGCPATVLVSQSFHTPDKESAARASSVQALVELHGEGVVKKVTLVDLTK